MNLDLIADGSQVLIDTNILVYARRGMSKQCQGLLSRCSDGVINGVLTTIGLAEYCHRRMMMEAQSKGLSSSNPARALSQDPKLVRQLAQYAQEVEDLLSGELTLVNIDGNDFTNAIELQRNHGILTNDSLQVSAALRVGIKNFATADNRLAVVSELQVFSPDDI